MLLLCTQTIDCSKGPFPCHASLSLGPQRQRPPRRGGDRMLAAVADGRDVTHAHFNDQDADARSAHSTPSP